MGGCFGHLIFCCLHLAALLLTMGVGLILTIPLHLIYSATLSKGK